MKSGERYAYLWYLLYYMNLPPPFVLVVDSLEGGSSKYNILGQEVYHE